jgi:hypothetical protein
MSKTMRKMNKKGGTMRNHMHKHMKMHKSYETTFHGLFKWEEHMFEKLGWMVLAKSKGYNDKVKAYVNSVHRLKKHIEHKLSHMHDEDKKEDLEILHHDVSVLCAQVDKDFM